MIKIVHLSDLHFGMKGQEEIWASLYDYLNNEVKPHIILVTGDIADTPRKNLFTNAKGALDKLRTRSPDSNQYIICSGNHDRHFRGNALGHLQRPLQIVTPNTWIDAWFDNTFAGSMATPGQSFAFNFDDEISIEWKICVLGLDSSTHARYSAQGFAEPNDLLLLESTAGRLNDAHLVIVLTHHHLLPIAALEGTKQSAGSLFNPTVMLNAGSMLEALARSSVNLVLHGHEHHRAVARYRMPKERGAEIVIVGAGSATGADTWNGCAFERASANLFELHADRSVFLREIRRNRDKWEISPVDPEDMLLSSQAIREARFYRRSLSTSKTLPTSQLIKTVEFHPNRDISIRETAINWIVEHGIWTTSTRNSSGRPSDGKVMFKWHQGRPDEFKCQFALDTRSDHSYRAVVDQITDDSERLAEQIIFSFKWLRGGILTSQDLAILEGMSAGSYRRDGMEYAGVLARDELVSLSLLVKIPEIFAPSENSVKVFYEEPDGSYHESVELKAAIRHYGVGIFSLEVAYPIKGFGYVLAWPPSKPIPPESAAVTFASTFCSNTRSKALLQAFLNALGDDFPQQRSSAALYLPTDNPHILVGSGDAVLPENLAWSAYPPGTLSLRETDSLHSWAWRGDIQAETVEAGERIPGFLSGERAVVVLPIRPSGREGGPPWGLIRLGVHAEANMTHDDLTKMISSEAFDRAMVAVLGAVHR